MKPFETITNLMDHQVDAVTKILPSRVGALFMEMGTGKTRTAIELIRLRQKKISKVVWFCPVSVKKTIEYEVKKHTNISSIHVFNGKTSETNIPESDFYIVGIESMSSCDRVVYTVNLIVDENTFVIVDESSYIKGPRSNRTMRIILISEKAKYRLVLTGTPISQGIEDLYSQMLFLSEKILGYKSWYSFQKSHIKYSERFPGKIEKTLNHDLIAEKIKPYVYQVTKEECLSLPGKIYDSHYVSLTNEQHFYMEKVKEEFLEDEYLLSDNPFRQRIAIFKLFTALQSISCGFYKKDVFENERISGFEHVLSTISKEDKIVVWAKYHHCIREIVHFCTENNIEYYEYHGGLSEKTRAKNLEEWRKSGKIFIATQACGGFGIDLTAAKYIIFYANGFKYSERIQAEDRNHRIGQQYKPTYINIWNSSKIDDRIASALARKGNAVEDFRQEIEKVKDKNKKEAIKRMVMSL